MTVPLQNFEGDVYVQENYISRQTALHIKDYFDNVINDSFSNGPKVTNKFTHKYSGCYDRPLRLERNDNPLHLLLEKLKKDFGDFYMHDGSIRYMNYPFGPHTDVVDQTWLLEQRQKTNSDGYIFLIPLWWEPKYTAGTAFFSSPPQREESLYIEHQNILPVASDSKDTKNFSIKQIVYWKNPGDLIAWKNFTWHSSLAPRDYNYSHNKFCKEFISIETWGVTNA